MALTGIVGEVAFAIIGAGPAGVAAAEHYRAARGSGRVLLIGEELERPYARPPLSKGRLRGELSRNAIDLHPEAWYAERQIDRLYARVTSLEHDHLRFGPTTLRFDQCLIATGAEAATLAVPGGAHGAILRLRRDSDCDRIRAIPEGETIAIVGSGFIGCEVAASLAMTGRRVTLATEEPLPQARRLGNDVAKRIAAWLEELDVTLHLASRVERISDGRVLRLASGEEISASRIIVGAGTVPRSELAQRVGMTLKDGRIPCDSRMRTLSSNLLAAGDVARAAHAIAGRSLAVEHWGDAISMGEVAGRTAAGALVRWKSVPGFWSTIGEHTIKHAAWGDGWDACHFVARAGASFSAWYGREGRLVGILTHERDDHYDRGRELIAARASFQTAVADAHG